MTMENIYGTEWKNKMLSFSKGYLVNMLAKNLSELEAKDREIARLNGLIARAHTRGWMDCPEEFAINPITFEKSWEKFKQENGL